MAGERLAPNTRLKHHNNCFIYLLRATLASSPLWWDDHPPRSSSARPLRARRPPPSCTASTQQVPPALPVLMRDISLPVPKLFVVAICRGYPLEVVGNPISQHHVARGGGRKQKKIIVIFESQKSHQNRSQALKKTTYWTSKNAGHVAAQCNGIAACAYSLKNKLTVQCSTVQYNAVQCNMICSIKTSSIFLLNKRAPNNPV